MAAQVAVCGPRDCTEAEAALAERVGELLAERRAVVICGGGEGVMAAVAAGAHGAGGLVVGVLPEAGRAGGNRYLSAAVATGVGQGRNAVIVESADAVIVIGGSWGTISEIALAMRRGGIPVVTLGGWQVLDAGGRAVPGPLRADSAEQAVSLALRGL